MGDSWVHLRLCMTCGHVGCCDSSKNKHATKHFHQTQHPIMRSIERGEDWGWCYIDDVELNFCLSPFARMTRLSFGLPRSARTNGRCSLLESAPTRFTTVRFLNGTA